MTPEDCSDNNDTAPHLGLSDRLTLLEDSVQDIEPIIEKIKTMFLYRILIGVDNAYSTVISKLSDAYDNFLTSKFYESYGHFIGKLTQKYYFEDYIRVYPNGMLFDHRGRSLKAGDDALKNYLNHVKFYKFVSQFIKDKTVVDIGCGSGYGCELLKNSGAADVYGADISKHAIQFANSKFGKHAKFSVQSITDLKEYSDDFFDVTLSSEVLEHIKEYGVEQKAIEELKRVTKNNGLVIIATPNNEMLDDHGFSYDELYQLSNKNFSKFCIFENAFIPSGTARTLWQRRLQEKRVGVIISEKINFSETFLPGGIVPEVKNGIEAGTYMFDTYEIDTKLLHNTHSWVVLTLNDK
jgi:2-polyprenyl-3-methyl-5-hydroxy-6-metoxy-1,4-benzoquinol methylase